MSRSSSATKPSPKPLQKEKAKPSKASKGAAAAPAGKKAKKGGKEKGAAKKGAAKKKPRSKYTAETADRHELYQLAVQSADLDVEFLRDTYKSIRGKHARHLREDFCGTALLCAEWIKLDAKNSAEGYDLDPEPLEWGKRKNLAPLGQAAERIQLFEADCRSAGRRAPDIRVVQNFSYWILQDRKELLGYFKLAHESLPADGILVLDSYGGTEANVEMLEERKVEGGFTYVWDQNVYYPATGEFHCNIHFEFRDGTKMENAFQYVWRMWGLPETKDLLYEAGFSQVDVYFEGSDEDDEEGEGNGIFEKDPKGENCESWIAYIVAQK